MSDQLPYQKHSQTSRDAAKQNTTAKKNREKIFALVSGSGIIGMIADEIAQELKQIPNAVSSRLGELESSGAIVKLENKRKTSCNRNANIYVLPEHVAGRVILPPKKSDKEIRAALKKENAALRTALKNIANSRPWYVSSNPKQIIEMAKSALK